MSALVWDAMCMGHAGGRHSCLHSLGEQEKAPRRAASPMSGPPSPSPLQGTVPKKIPGQSASCPLAQESYPRMHGILIPFTPVLGHCPQRFRQPTLHLFLVSCSLRLYLSLSPPLFVSLPPSLLHPQIQNSLPGGYW